MLFDYHILLLVHHYWVHPLFLEARSEASQQDNPSWWQAMNGPFADEYWKAACVEVETHREYGCKGGQKYYMHIITISLNVSI